MKLSRFFFLFILVGIYISTSTSCVHEPILPEGYVPQDTITTPVDTTTIPPDTVSSGGPVAKPCDPDTVYFERDVLPILISNCAMSNCHDDETKRDGISLTSFGNVIASDEVDPFDLDGSDLYEVLVETDPDKAMPPPPRDVLSQSEIDIIAKWITQGAQNLTCTEDTTRGCNTENVSFSSTVFPILDMHCTGCHSGNDARGNVKLDSYGEVKKKADDGGLYGSIAHLSGYAKMPRNANKLPDCDIAQIKAWIDAGAENN